jgi:signal transduction histidine kinase
MAIPFLLSSLVIISLFLKPDNALIPSPVLIFNKIMIVFGLWVVLFITYKKHEFENALSNSEKRLRETLDNILEGAQIVGFNWEYLYLNDVAAKQGKRQKEELINHTMLEMYPGIEKTALFRSLQTCMEQRISTSLETGFTFPDGSKGWFELKIHPIPEGIFILSIDITDIITQATSLRESKETLERLVQQRTEALLESRIELERAKRLSDIGALATTVAHELRNPLAGINLAAYNIQRKTHEKELLGKHIETIEKKVIESNQIIDNLLFFSTLKPPNMQPACLYELIKESEEIAKSKAKCKTVRINNKSDILKDLLIEVDPLQIKEVFGNIFNNAIEAFTEQSEITVLVNQDGKYIKITITDTGIGMDKDVKEKAFRPFFSTKSKGTGLGLTVSKQIIENHNGSISIESTKGKGTSIILRLPRN